MNRPGTPGIVRVKTAKLTYPVLSVVPRGRVRTLVEDGASKVVLDLEAVSYIDSETIGCLVDIHRLVTDRGSGAALWPPAPCEQHVVHDRCRPVPGSLRASPEALASFELRFNQPYDPSGVLRTMWSHDVRYAIRLLRRSPGFAATAILTLAVSIGANAAIWSAVKGILVAPLPYPDPDRLVRLFEEASTTPHFPFAPADFRDYRAELRTFDAIAAYGRSDLQLGDAQPPEQLRGMRVSAGFFTLVGHPPALGRDVEQGDELQGAADVVILSHTLWMRRFQGDPAPWHCPEHFFHGFRSGAEFLFQQHLTCLIQHAVPARPIAQIQANR